MNRFGKPNPFFLNRSRKKIFRPGQPLCDTAAKFCGKPRVSCLLSQFPQHLVSGVFIQAGREHIFFRIITQRKAFIYLLIPEVYRILRRTAHRNIIQTGRFFSRGSSYHPAKPLNPLTRNGSTAQYNTSSGIGNIDAFVKTAAAHKYSDPVIPEFRKYPSSGFFRHSRVIR